MKHKSTHISWIIICILVAAGSFVGGMLYGEKMEKRRITKGFVEVFQQNFGQESMGSGSMSTGSK